MFNKYLFFVLALFFSLNSHAEGVLNRCATGEPGTDGEVDIGRGIDLGDILSGSLGRNTAIAPVLQLEPFSSEKIINLTPNRDLKKLAYGDYKDGFKVVRAHGLDFGLGAVLSFQLGNCTGLSSLAFASVGLIPVQSESLMTTQYARNKAAIENLPDFKTTPDVRALGGLTPGDTVNYTSQGGIIFFAGVSATVIGLNVAAYAGGEFEHYIQKIDADHVFVRITKKDIKSFGLQAGNIIVNAETKNYDKYAQAFSFVVNFNTDLGSKVYSDLLVGNIAPVQKLATESSTDAVKLWEKTDSNRMGRISSFYIGLPWLFSFSKGTETFSELARTEAYYCNQTLDVRYGVYMKEKATLGLHHEDNKQQGFYGTAFELKDGSKKVMNKGFFGQLLWSYYRDGSHYKSFNDAIDEVSALTGLGLEMALDIPETSDDDLEYTAINVRAHFGLDNTNSLIAHANSMNRSEFEDAGVDFVTEYFATGKDEDLLCKHMNLKSCENKMEKKVIAAANEMYDAINNISDALSENDTKRATTSYAKFGKAMLTNQFSFKLGAMLAGKGLNLDYVVEGTGISKHVATMTSDVDGDFARVDRLPIFTNDEGTGKVTTFPTK